MRFIMKRMRQNLGAPVVGTALGFIHKTHKKHEKEQIHFHHEVHEGNEVKPGSAGRRNGFPETSFLSGVPT